MKIFRHGGQIALTREDVLRAIQLAYNSQIRTAQDEIFISSITIHPDSKYVIKCEIKPDVKVA